jgi:hypothetical protein
VTLAKAREKAARVRECVDDGRDPLAEKNAEDRMPTFGELADRHITTMEPSWRNPKHRTQWEMTLREYAKPLRAKPVNEITTADVLAVLHPIWQTIPETASRVRGRIENVLDAAKVQGCRTGENPAAWHGHLKLILPARQKLTRGHHCQRSWQVCGRHAAGSGGGSWMNSISMTQARIGCKFYQEPSNFVLAGSGAARIAQPTQTVCIH